MIKLLKNMQKREWLMALACAVFVVGQVYFDLTLPDYMTELTTLIKTEGSATADIAAVDLDAAAGTDRSAAESGFLITAGCGNTAAVDGDVAAGTTISVTISAADSGAITSAGYGQRSHVFPDRLGINGKTVALCHIDAAVDGQACAIRQNQVNLAADGDAAADGHITFDHIPACTPCDRAAFHLSDRIRCLYTAVCVQIGNAVLRQ